MSNATAPVRITPRQDNSRSIPVYLADGYTFYDGTVLVNGPDGYALPATSAGAGTSVAGILAPKFGSLASQGRIVVASGDTTVASDVIVGVFDLPQDGSIDEGDVGGNVYLLNDHEVSTNSGSGIALPCVALNSDGSVQVLIAFKSAVQ